MISEAAEHEIRQGKIRWHRHLNVIGPAFDNTGEITRLFDGRGFIGNWPPCQKRRLQCRLEHAVTEHLWRQSPPERRSVDRCPNPQTRRPCLFKRIRNRCRQKPANLVCDKLFAQPVKIVWVQAWPGRIMHQHPVALAGPAFQSPQGRKYRISPFSTALATGNAVIIAGPGFTPPGIITADRDNTARQFEVIRYSADCQINNQISAQREILLGPGRLHAGASTSGRDNKPESRGSHGHGQRQEGSA